jgi:TrmH family RNA methyltransferase
LKPFVKHISSSSNPTFKALLSLEKSKQRKLDQLAIVEGHIELAMAFESGLEFVQLFYTNALKDSSIINKIANQWPQLAVFELSQDLYAKTVYRASTEHIFAVIKTQMKTLDQLQLPNSPLILIVEGVEKPGNLGAILRTADASAVDAVICCDLPGDLYNPNTIRASLGTVFTVPIVLTDADTLQKWLTQKQITCFCSNLHKAVNYFELDYTKASAIVVGTEATGVSDKWIEYAQHQVKIPMLGKIDSMNVSVATAIMLYEARRQRLGL